MLSAKSLFKEIVDNDESFQLFCSIAASGESQGGWENGRIAALVPLSERASGPQDHPTWGGRGQTRANLQRPAE
ncbi:hypothetical protein SALBM311S_09653 [Streptomyces alboniger]